MAFFRTTIRGKVPGDIYQFGFVLQHDSDIAGLAEMVAGAWTTAYGTTQRADFNTGVTFDDVLVQELSAGTGTVIDAAVEPIGTAGTASVGMLAPQTSMCVSVLPVTGVVRGRFYLPPMNQGATTATGQIGGSKVTVHGTALQAFFNDLGGDSEPARLGIWRSTTNAFVASKGISIGNVWDTQRRRRNKLVEVRTEFLVL
jgi:hypothetical protein